MDVNLVVVCETGPVSLARKQGSVRLPDLLEADDVGFIDTDGQGIDEVHRRVFKGPTVESHDAGGGAEAEIDNRRSCAGRCSN